MKKKVKKVKKTLRSGYGFYSFRRGGRRR
jgi:hypothetical protein